MDQMEQLEQLRGKYEKDRFATVNGAMIEEASDGYARCKMRITDSHKNALGTVMGGAVFTLADFAFAVAANGIDDKTVSLDASITFLGKAKGEWLTAEAKRLREGTRTCCYTVEITDGLGNQVAHMVANGFHI